MPNSYNYKCVYFMDLDGVLADNSHRMIHMYSKDYEKFYSREEIMKDTAYPRMIYLARYLADSLGADLVFVTGRNESCRDATKDWLSLNGIDPLDYTLLMRPQKDHRDAAELKPELITNYLKLNNVPSSVIKFFFDDQYSNINAIKKIHPDIITVEINQ